MAVVAIATPTTPTPLPTPLPPFQGVKGGGLQLQCQLTGQAHSTGVRHLGTVAGILQLTGGALGESGAGGILSVLLKGQGGLRVKGNGGGGGNVAGEEVSLSPSTLHPPHHLQVQRQVYLGCGKAHEL